ncbi:hypothetical protein HNQ56_004239 [Anaerotaenia torta]|uniref:hypothetical protein n=1 Tax=Anaerotaenia torta TaxID=433293 RepID=UPI003D242E59
MIKVRIKLTDVDYEQIAERFIPDALERASDSDNIAMKLAGRLLVKDGETSPLAKGMLGLFPKQTKDMAAYHLIVRNLDRLREGMTHALAREMPGMHIETMRALNTEENMYDVIRLELVMGEINYGLVLEHLIRRFLEGMAQKPDKSGELAMLFLAVDGVAGRMAAAFDSLSQEEKDLLLVRILSIYREEITEGVNEGFRKQKITAKVAEMKFRG